MATRKEFKELLESIKIPSGTSADEMKVRMLPLHSALLQMAPYRLFKYRTCCDDNISAFEKDQLWLATSDKFNDPFDTLIQFDKEELSRALDALSSPDVFAAFKRYFAAGGQIPPQVSRVVDCEEIARLRGIAKEEVSSDAAKGLGAQEKISLQLMVALCVNFLPQIVQRFSTVVCLSERIDSILMWSHYADNHKGFALGYDLRPFLSPNDQGIGLFPVVYDEKRYDANEFIIWLFCSLLQIPAVNPDLMSSIKLLLYKSLDWEYEREWRLIRPNNTDLFKGKAEPIIFKPNSIYYGCRISDSDRERLHEIAVDKGIEEYVMSVDNAKDSYRVNSVAFTEK